MKMLTVTQAAKMLNVTPALIRIYIRQGLFPGAIKVRGTRWQIPAAAVDLFDGTDVSGAFAKRKKSPFCKIVRDKNSIQLWICYLAGDVFDTFDCQTDAEIFAQKVNIAAEKWLENA